MNVDQYEKELVLAGAAPRLARMLAQRFAHIHKQHDLLDTKVGLIDERVDDLEIESMTEEG